MMPGVGLVQLTLVVWAAEAPWGGRPRGPRVPREAPRDIKNQQDFENDHTEGRGKREEGRREEGKKGRREEEGKREEGRRTEGK